MFLHALIALLCFVLFGNYRYNIFLAITFGAFLYATIRLLSWKKGRGVMTRDTLYSILLLKKRESEYEEICLKRATNASLVGIIAFVIGIFWLMIDILL